MWAGAGKALQGLITQVYRNETMRMVSQSSILEPWASSILEPSAPKTQGAAVAREHSQYPCGETPHFDIGNNVVVGKSG